MNLNLRHSCGRLSVALVALLAGVVFAAQPLGRGPMNPSPNGPHEARPTRHAITGATVFVRPGEVLEGATVVMEDGRIVAVGPEGLAAGEGAQTHDGTGLFVYPAFVEAYLEVDAPKPDRKSAGAHWNALVTPERRALDGAGVDEKTRESLREQGFAAAGIAPKGGVLRGQGAVVGLGEPAARASEAFSPVYRDRAFHAVGFDTAGWRDGQYPTAIIGAVALIRQCLMDAAWQAAARDAGERIPGNALDAIAGTGLLVFDCDHPGKVALADRILDESGRLGNIVGSGREIELLDAVAGTGRSVILPVNYPEAPDVWSPGAADAAELTDLMLWEQVPTTARRLDAAGATVALTTHRLKKRSQFLGNVRRAIKEGLGEDKALAMLTTVPADLLGVGDQVGTLEVGRRANVLVTDRPVFAEGAKVLEVWVDGGRNEVTPREDRGFDGAWALTIGDSYAATLTIAGDGAKVREDAAEGADAPEARDARKVKIDGSAISMVLDDVEGTGSSILSGSRTSVDGLDRISGQGRAADESLFQWTATRIEHPASWKDLSGTWHARLAGRFTLGLKIDGEGKITVFDRDAAGAPAEVDAREVSLQGDRLALIFDHGVFGWGGDFVLRARVVGDRLVGEGNRSDGQPFTWVAWKGSKKKDTFEPAREALAMPFGPYAGAVPDAQAVVVRGATIWTSGPRGLIEDGVLFVNDGEVAWVGSADEKINLQIPAGTLEIDAAGKHITPGIIDAHSHTGLFRFGVNEGGDQITSEVRIHDALDPTHINWYRQLAGGVTTVNSLHGSANPIGGQSATHKVRWGVTDPEAMLLEDAMPGIKFALGENVTQKNWDAGGTRYPQTRMGVEAIIRDRFLAAREYAAARDAAAAAGEPFRRDLELEPIAEILAGKRLIHCHSYRQDEILMLCDLAREFGFTIGSFQHVLEGYKVAEHVREVARGASAFSDWWGFKVEVQDAIPAGGPIMHEAGVVVSYNSDSDDLARRMNTEAAKAVRYGLDLPPEEALKFVTLNPAIQLAIEDRVGSLEKGKDGDFVVWSGNPLSTTSRCEQTWIEGRPYFTLERDAAMREANRAERARLIQKIVAEGRPEPKGEKPAGSEKDATGEQPGGDAEDPPPEIVHLMEHLIEEVARGINPTYATCGVCGVGGIHTLGGH